MRDFFQEFILNQYVVGLVLLIVLAFITRWALMEKKEYAGYGLGWVISILLLVIYTILFGDRVRMGEKDDLTFFQIFLAIFLGLACGFAAQYRRFLGKPRPVHVSRRNIALQVALYTTLNLILLGLVIIESSVVQRMIGIYGLALGATVLLGMIWSTIDEEQPAQQQAAPQQPPPQAGYRPPQPPPPSDNRYNNPSPNFPNKKHK